MQPTGSDQLLAQMSQIGQLQSSTQMQDAITSMAQQSQIGSAGNLIGKNVSGTDAQHNPVAGIVDSVRVQSDGVYLELHTGQELSMANVTKIAPAPTLTTTAPTTGA